MNADGFILVRPTISSALYTLCASCEVRKDKLCISVYFYVSLSEDSTNVDEI
jgi:hypothetical protein